MSKIALLSTLTFFIVLSPISSLGEKRPLVISQGSDALTLDPQTENETPTFSVISNMFDTLVQFNRHLKLAPGLATSWETPDDLTWIFHLRRGVKFHNGEPFKADDVKFTIDRAQNYPLSEIDSDVAAIASVRVLDDYTVEIKTGYPSGILLNHLAQVYILSRDHVEQKGHANIGDKPVGTGPYKFVEWVRDDHITMIANEEYWAGDPTIKKAVFRPISNDATRVAALVSGEVDIVADVPVRDVDRIEKSDSAEVRSLPSLRLIYLRLDVGRKVSPRIPLSENPFQKLKVRQAIYYAINEEAIVKHVMNGHAYPAAQLFPPSVFGYNPDIQRHPYDPVAARKLLAEAGYPDGFTVTLDTPSDRYVNDAEIAQAVASQLAKIGINVIVDARPKSIFFPFADAGNSSFCIFGWANSHGDGSGSLDYLFRTIDDKAGFGRYNDGFYSNSEVDRLAEAASRTIVPEERLRYLQQAVAIIMEDLPIIPLHYQEDIYGISKRVVWNPRIDKRVKAFEVAYR